MSIEQYYVSLLRCVGKQRQAAHIVTHHMFGSTFFMQDIKLLLLNFISFVIVDLSA